MTISAAYPEMDVRLLQAAGTAKLLDAEDLLAEGADVNCRGEHDGRTPLHMAALNGQREMANLLLNRGAARDIFDDAGDTPMHLAARQGHDGVVKLFIARGSSINLPNERTGETPLMTASHDKALAAAAQLLAANADTDAQDKAGETALMKAAKNNQPGAVEALVRGFADIYMTDQRGCTAFDLAKEAKAGAACVVLYPHHEANDLNKTYDMAQKLRASGKISVKRPLKFRKPGDA